MRTYTIEILRTAEIYQLDSELASLARKLANENYESLGAGKMGFGQLKEEFLAGQHAQLVFDRLNQLQAAELAEMLEAKRLVGLVEKLTLPAGVTVTQHGSMLKIKVPFDGGDLNRRLNKKGGRWDGYEKCIVAPLSAVESLPKILANWAKAQGIAQQEKATAEAKRQAQGEAERKAQQSIWDEERRREAEQRKAAQAAEDSRRARAVASRIQVTAGQYKIGDMLEGRRITGFGKSWTETESGTWGNRGLRYDEQCAGCRKVTVIDNWTELCERCGADGESVTVCYAYFE